MKMLTLRNSHSRLVGFSLALALFAVAPACGKKEDTPANSSTDASASSLATNATAQDEVDAEQSNDVAEALSEESFGAASLTNSENSDGQIFELAATRTCTESATGVAVKRTFTHSGNVSASLGKASISKTWELTSNQTNTWTNPTAGEAIKCTAATGVAKIDFSKAANVEGAKLVINVDRSLSSSSSRTNRKGETFASSRSITAKGERSITWGKPTVDSNAGTATVDKTITSKVTRTLDFKRANDKNTKVDVSVEVKSAAPMVVSVVRSTTSGAWISKTVKSGTIITTNNTDGSRMESKWENVVWAKGKCIPTGGTITRSAFEKDGTTAKATAVIKFGQDTDSTVSISRNGGAAEDFAEYGEAMEGCALKSE